MTYDPGTKWTSYAQPGAAVSQAEIDLGLRRYMLQVYNYMAIGLGLTGAVAFLILTNTDILSLFANIQGNRVVGLTMLGWIALFAPLAFVFFFSFKIHSMSFATAQMTFWAFAALMGVSLAPTLFVYTGASVARVFFITAATFAAMSLYGYTTKRDLSGMGSFLFMGLIGIIIASIVNIFIASSALQFAISVIGVLIFVGLTAYDTQQIKEVYLESDDSETMGKKAIYGSLQLYLDFINLFTLLLQLVGIKKDE
ncbi:MAG: Bax inhibitor-1/YccA family protein [Alphaproteobacteria bacterium]|nr:Bax inhibitor-1/YccA family protein [Alphaproteobacteria bacterium]